jgi:1-acyl-sn-glycerol-3-phosphate acyltransferase
MTGKVAAASVPQLAHPRRLRACWRVMRVALHLLHGLFIVATYWRWLNRDARLRRIEWWATKLLRVLGIAHQARGVPRPGGALIAANHVSWLDIVAIHAQCPHARFVSKSEVRHWPLIGRLVDAAGTLYLERERRRDALRVVHDAAQALQGGQTVAVFPEGTTGDGRTLLPFHANMLQAAIVGSTPVQPVALRFSDEQHAVSPSAAYVGDTSLLQSLWWVVCAQGLTVHVHWLSPQGSAHADRRALAEHVRQCIAEALSEAT